MREDFEQARFSAQIEKLERLGRIGASGGERADDKFGGCGRGARVEKAGTSCLPGPSQGRCRTASDDGGARQGRPRQAGSDIRS